MRLARPALLALAVGTASVAGLFGPAFAFEGTLEWRSVRIPPGELLALLSVGDPSPTEVFAIPSEVIAGLARSAGSGIELDLMKIRVKGTRMRIDLERNRKDAGYIVADTQTGLHWMVRPGNKGVRHWVDHGEGATDGTAETTSPTGGPKAGDEPLSAPTPSSSDPSGAADGVETPPRSRVNQATVDAIREKVTREYGALTSEQLEAIMKLVENDLAGVVAPGLPEKFEPMGESLQRFGMKAKGYGKESEDAVVNAWVVDDRPELRAVFQAFERALRRSTGKSVPVASGGGERLEALTVVQRLADLGLPLAIKRLEAGGYELSELTAFEQGRVDDEIFVLSAETIRSGADSVLRLPAE